MLDFRLPTASWPMDAVLWARAYIVTSSLLLDLCLRSSPSKRISLVLSILAYVGGIDLVGNIINESIAVLTLIKYLDKSEAASLANFTHSHQLGNCLSWLSLAIHCRLASRGPSKLHMHGGRTWVSTSPPPKRGERALIWVAAHTP